MQLCASKYNRRELRSLQFSKDNARTAFLTSTGSILYHQKLFIARRTVEHSPTVPHRILLFSTQSEQMMAASENFTTIDSLLERLKLETTSPEAAETVIRLQGLIQLEKQRSTGILQKFRLDNQVALVTGGSRGIGYALAQALGEAGCKVAIASINFENAKKAADQLKGQGIQTLAIQVDVAQKASVDTMLEKVIETWGQVHIAVNNAGILEGGDAEDFTEDKWDQIMGVNLKGVFLCAQAEARYMLKNGYGRIINIGSISGHVSGQVQNEAFYETSKAGVIRMTKAMAAEWADKGVTVNCISPGYIDTDMNNQPDCIPLHEKWLCAIPMKRFAQADELSGAALLLASSLSSYMTGSDIIVDGGYVLW